MTGIKGAKIGKRRKTLRDHLKAFGGALVIVSLTLVLIEILLRAADPWGLSYFNDIAYMGNEGFMFDSQRGYIMRDGQYQFSHWTTTVEDEMRVVPDTNRQAECEIIILGDSVAYGYGVDDTDTWVNQLAQQIPDVHLKNAAVTRYNSTNVLGNLQYHSDADAYLYLITGNDFSPAIELEASSFIEPGENQWQLILYASYAILQLKTNDVNSQTDDDIEVRLRSLRANPGLSRLLSEMEQIAADERVTLAAFRHELLTTVLLEEGFDLVLLDYPPYSTSLADYHLNSQGNLELANQLLPTLQTMRDTHCPA